MLSIFSPFRLFVASLLVAAPSAAVPAEPDFSAQRFRAHVAFLSDDLLEGRDTGSRGYDIAASYVASQFEALGLKPGGENGGWYQQVPLRSATLGGEPPVLTITGPRRTQSRFDNGVDVIVGPSAFEKVQDVEAPVVFAGYGIDAPTQGLDDYRGLDVKGKIVAVLSGAPANLDSEIASHLNRQKSAMAARRGAVGLVTLPTAEADATTPWELRVSRMAPRRMTWVDGERGIDDADGLRVTATLNTISALALFADAPRSYAAVRAEAERRGARPQGFALRTSVRIQRTSVWTDVASPEVIAVLPGSDPALRDEYVVLMGHLDHLGMKSGAAPDADNIYNGALDNAAGIATMLEAARAFVESGAKPRRSILFIANTAEEKGLLGADYFAHFPTVPIDRIAAVVDLDMPLLLYDFTDVIAFGAEHSTVALAVEKAARSMGIALSPDPMPEEHVFVRSDHYAFVKQGVPAILLATGFANGGEAQWRNYLANIYHSVGDDMNLPIRWESGARYARLNYLISRELADADARPLWYQGDLFGDLYAPGKPRAPER